MSEGKVGGEFMRCQPLDFAGGGTGIAEGRGDIFEKRRGQRLRRRGDERENVSHQNFQRLGRTMGKGAAIDKLKAVVIAGATASGKSALATELAMAFGGTIVNADSM